MLKSRQASLWLFMSDSNSQWKERHFHQCNWQATIEIPLRPGSLYCCLCVAAFMKRSLTARFKHVTRCAATQAIRSLELRIYMVTNSRATTANLETSTKMSSCMENGFHASRSAEVIMSDFKSRVRHFSCWHLHNHNSPADSDRELFKPSEDAVSLLA